MSKKISLWELTLARRAASGSGDTGGAREAPVTGVAAVAEVHAVATASVAILATAIAALAAHLVERVELTDLLQYLWNFISLVKARRRVTNCVLLAMASYFLIERISSCRYIGGKI